MPQEQEQQKYNERLLKEVAIRKKILQLTDQEVDDLLELLRSNDGKPINERIVREEHRESNHVD
jgi:hypothetical protein